MSFRKQVTCKVYTEILEYKSLKAHSGQENAFVCFLENFKENH